MDAASQPLEARLRELQRRLDASEERCAALARELAAAQRSGNGNGGSDDSDDATDAVLRELRRSVVDLTRRNTALERDAVERGAAMRRQFEAHIESLEWELRRARAGLVPGPAAAAAAASASASAARAATPPTAALAHGASGVFYGGTTSLPAALLGSPQVLRAPPAESVVFQSPVPVRPVLHASAGRTPDSRRNLI